MCHPGRCLCVCVQAGESHKCRPVDSLGMGPILSCLRLSFFVVLLLLSSLLCFWGSVSTSQLLGMQYWEYRLQCPHLVELDISPGNLNSGLHAYVPCILATETPCFSFPSSSSSPSFFPPPSSSLPPTLQWKWDRHTDALLGVSIMGLPLRLGKQVLSGSKKWVQQYHLSRF